MYHPDNILQLLYYVANYLHQEWNARIAIRQRMGKSPFFIKMFFNVNNMGHCAEMEQQILPTLSKDTIAKLNIIIAKANMMWILRMFGFLSGSNEGVGY